MKAKAKIVSTEPLLSIADVAARLKKSKRTVERWIARSLFSEVIYLPGCGRQGHCPMVPEHAYQEFLRIRTVRAVEKEQ